MSKQMHALKFAGSTHILTISVSNAYCDTNRFSTYHSVQKTIVPKTDAYNNMGQNCNIPHLLMVGVQTFALSKTVRNPLFILSVPPVRRCE